MSAAVLPPARHHFESRPDTKSMFPNHNMNALPRQSPYSTMASASNTADANFIDASEQQSVAPPSRTMSRFQQLLNLKLAAEQNASSSSQPIRVDSSPLDLTFAQAQSRAANTVFHKSFIAPQLTPEGMQQPVAASQKPSIDPRSQAQPPQQQYPPGQAQHSAFSQASHASQPRPQGQAGQYGQQMAHARRTSQPLQQSTPMQFSAGLSPNQIPQQQSPNNQYGLRAAASPPQVTFPGSGSAITSDSWNGQFNATNDDGRSQSFSSNRSSVSGSLSVPNTAGQWQIAQDLVVKKEPQWEETAGMNGWLPFAQPPQASNAQASLQQPKISATPSFSWNVSEVRSSSDAGPSYLPQQPMDHTPALSPSHALAPSASSSAPSPITPMGGPMQFAGSNNLPLPYSAIKVEPETQLLSVPYPHQTRPSSSSSDSSSSPLLEYGHRMFTNMNGAFQLPGQMYMSNSADIPTTLANGMAGSNHEAGAGSGSNGDGWANGNGDCSGSGMGGHGGSGNGSGDDRNGDDGDDDRSNGNHNNGRKPKKLALACHFCRRRKLKCNGVHPICDNCTKRNETCTWDDNVRRRGPGKATKERREKAAREAAAAGLTNEDSMDVSALSALNHTPDQLEQLHQEGELPIADAIATLPVDLKEVDVNEHPHQLPFDSTVPVSVTTDGEDLEAPPDMDIPIDPALAALSEAVLPHTLAELEVKKGGEKRKSVDQQSDQPDDKRIRLGDSLDDEI
ncbi:hypothetical protein I317_02001 [Kwoniella heveanensis CBS 569]|nr:hypothetical protein I317_02001 [Kwoniella heveanensis CBS 569]